MSLSVVIDGASKAAAAVGVVLGMSYMAGLSKTIGFYGEFHVDWLFDMLDVQAYINEGLPLTSLCLIVFFTHFFGIKKLHDKYTGWHMLIVVISTSLIAAQAVLSMFPSMSYYLLAAGVVGSAGAALAAWIAHGNVFPSRSVVDLYHMIMALALVLGLCPYLVGQARAIDVQKAGEGATEIVDASNRVVGVLVRVVAGKYLVLDCNVQGQLSFYEISASLKLRRASGRCSAYL